MKRLLFAHGKYSERGKVKDRTYMESLLQNGFPFAAASLALPSFGRAHQVLLLTLLFLKVYLLINDWLQGVRISP